MTSPTPVVILGRDRLNDTMDVLRFRTVDMGESEIIIASNVVDPDEIVRILQPMLAQAREDRETLRQVSG